MIYTCPFNKAFMYSFKIEFAVTLIQLKLKTELYEYCISSKHENNNHTISILILFSSSCVIPSKYPHYHKKNNTSTVA